MSLQCSSAHVVRILRMSEVVVPLCLPWFVAKSVRNVRRWVSSPLLYIADGLLYKGRASADGYLLGRGYWVLAPLWSMLMGGGLGPCCLLAEVQTYGERAVGSCVSDCPTTD